MHNERLVPLESLPDFHVADGYTDIRGFDAFTADGRQVGRVDHLLVDPDARRVALFPVRFDDCRGVVVHETADPEVIVVEYELVGTHTTTGVTASAPFIGVLRTRDGKLAHWREYQHTLVIAQAAGQA